MTDFLINLENNASSNNIEEGGIFLTVVFTSILLMPIFILIKYLSLPIVLLSILKWSKKETIKHWIKTLAENYKFQVMILFIVFVLDIIFSFIFHIIHRYYMLIYSNTFYNELLLNLIIFGGLTGSYLTLFLFLFFQKKLRNRNMRKQ